LFKKAKKSAAFAAAICLGAAALPACSVLPQEEEPLKPPIMKPYKAEVQLHEVKLGNASKQVKGTANFTSAKSEQYYFKESGGRLLSIDVSAGDAVKKGQVLARLEKGDLETRIRKQQLNLEKATIMLEQTKAEKSGDDRAIRLKQIDVESAQLELDQLKEQLAKTILVAESDGIVTFVEKIKPGDPIVAFKPVAAVSDPNKVQLTHEYTFSSEYGSVQVQMDATITYKGKEYAGKVVQANIDQTQSDKSSKLIVMTAADLPKAAIGEQADFVITTEKKDNVILIPKAGLRSYMGREYVQVMDGERRKEIDVETGLVTSTEVEIRKGLSAGQQIILN